MKTILVSGLNPSWQKTMTFQELRHDEVNRALSLEECASGKGVNFARAVSIAGLAKAQVFQFVGGMTGDLLIRRLAEEGLNAVSQPTPGATRICATLLCRKTGRTTELIEPTAPVGPEPQLRLQAAMADALERADALAICGTAPPDLMPDFHAKAVRRAATDGKPILLDTTNQTHALLDSGANILKINAKELSSITGGSCVAENVRALMARHASLQIVAITDGAHPAFLATRVEAFRLLLPHLPDVRNVIGSGDVCSAVLLSNLLTGVRPADAFRSALAAAMANCLTESPARFDCAEAERIAPAIRCEMQQWEILP